MTGAIIPSSVCLRSGLVLVGLTSGVATADARGGVTRGVVIADGGVDAGTNGVAIAEGRSDGVTSGVDVADAAVGRADAGRGAGVDGTASLGNGAAAGISSAPHSESMSSVGGAMDGIGGRPLTRSLSDRLSVIALTSPFHGPAHKSSARGRSGCKER